MPNQRNKVAAFIPVRGGSKSIPFKNIKPIAGQPLVYWVIKAALKSENIDKVFVSTDSEQIVKTISIIESDKLEIISRSPETATDEATTESALLEFCEKYDEFEDVFLIQATSPLLLAKELDEAYEEYQNYDSILSAVSQKRFIWNKKGEPENYMIDKRPRRQEFEGFLVENGAFYLSERASILASKNRVSGKIGIYEMDENSYFELDEPDDWVIVEELLKKKYPNYIKRAAAKEIKMLMMDVDGVLTDAGMYYTENGDELKKFSTYDGKAVEILRAKNIKTAIITAENTEIVKRRAEKIKVDYLYQGIKDKLKIARQIAGKENISLEQVAYIGDDVNDLELLKNVGLAACPDNAVDAVKSIPGIIKLSASGGNGAVRSFLKYVLGEVLPEEVAYTRKHLRTLRPWGSFETLTEKHNFKVKRITVEPGGKLSLQSHHHRSEHWTIVQGKAKVTIENEIKELKRDQSIYIPLGAKHRLENEHDVPLEIIEVQMGSYLEEDDIIRFEDIYGRV